MKMTNPISAIKIAGEEEASSIPTPTNGDHSLSLYFHVPFCTKKCGYCHFFVLPYKLETEKAYTEALGLELRLKQERISQSKIYSIYFGGGTPSLLDPIAFEKILSQLSFEKSTEITLEANPEQLTIEKLRDFKKVGINRLSIGAQSFDNNLLKALGRTHDSHQTIEAIENATKAGFDNISIDLMYDLPGQNVKAWRHTLKTACTLPITHLSLYNLQIEEGTLFHKKRKELIPKMPDPEVSLEMYQSARDTLSSEGLIPYEISAFAKKGFFSKHNTSYWLAREFLGLGPSAFSYVNGIRFRNPLHFGNYCEALKEQRDPMDYEDKLSIDARRKELLAIEIRLAQGVDLEIFENRHGPLDQETLQSIHTLIQSDWVKQEGSKIFLTDAGILFYDSVAVELI